MCIYIYTEMQIDVFVYTVHAYYVILRDEV